MNDGFINRTAGVARYKHTDVHGLYKIRIKVLLLARDILSGSDDAGDQRLDAKGYT